LRSTETRGGFQLIWDFSDVMNGAMAIPNLIGLVVLSGVVVEETRKLFVQRPES
jgi:AGCS family alanine or glycine:cation symporter